MEILYLLFISFFPTFLITIFANGKWPLAYKIHLSYLLIYIVLTAIVIYFLNQQRTVSRGSPINLSGLYLEYIFVTPIYLILIGITYYLSTLPPSAPLKIFTSLQKPSLILCLFLTTFFTYTFFLSNGLLILNKFPTHIKLPIYQRWFSQPGQFYEIEEQVKKIIALEIKNRKNSSEVSEIVQALTQNNIDLAYYTIFTRTMYEYHESKFITLHKERFIKNVCAENNKKINDEFIMQIFHSSPDYDLDNEKIVLPLLKCLDHPEKVFKPRLNVITNLDLAQIIWKDFSFALPYFLIADGDQQVQLLKESKNIKPSALNILIKETLGLLKEEYNANKINKFDHLLKYIFTHYDDFITDEDKHKSLLNLMYIHETWSHDLLYQLNFPREIWGITEKYSKKNILNLYFDRDRNLEKYLLNPQKYTDPDEIKEREYALAFIQYALKKGLEFKSLDNDFKLDLVFLKKTYGIK
jgi:hypothetical protein